MTGWLLVATGLLIGLSDTSGRPDANYVEDTYALALQEAGHHPVVIARNEDTNSLRRIVSALDAVVFTGGKDVAPERYGAVRSPKCGEPDLARDAFEFALYSVCVELHKPIVGICRGVQTMNVFFGGTLYQDIPSEYKPSEGLARCVHGKYPYAGGRTNPPLHEVSFVPGSRLARVLGVAPMKVNSHHHQGVRDLAPGFKVAARATDGFVEAIEHQSYPAFGVQFHPENTVARRPQTGFDLPRHRKFFERLEELWTPSVAVTDAPFAMPPIVLPTFPARDFSIADYGARPDGSNCRNAFAAAVDACASAGGGRIVVPAGRWTTGAIALKSNCTLNLAEGAEVVFTQNPSDYLPAVRTSWEGVECLNYSPAIYAFGCTNVAVTGRGVLRGFEGPYETSLWRQWARPADGSLMVVTKCLYDWMSDGAAVETRDLTAVPQPRTRPHLVQFNRCANVLVEDVRIRESPFWTIHAYCCDNVVIRRTDIRATGHNTDGVDIESSRNCLVEDCRFDQGDDGVVIKAARNRDGWELARPCANVVVRRCELVNGHTLLGVGSELSGGVWNVAAYDCVANVVKNLFFVKTNPRRGGLVSNIHFKNIRAKKADCVVALRTDFYSRWKAFPDRRLSCTRIDGLHVSDVSCDTAGRLIDLRGDVRLPAGNVTVSNVACRAVGGRACFSENVANVRLENVTVHGEEVRLETVREGRCD